jgi:hypothetical protein
MACRPGSFLNGVAKNKALVSSDNHISPGMFDALLDLRFDPRLSIVTAAEYGLANLTTLQKERLVAPDIGYDDRAWYIYLAHHEGLEGAEKFLRKEGSVPFSKLVEQVGDEARANALVAAAGGDVTPRLPQLADELHGAEDPAISLSSGEGACGQGDRPGRPGAWAVQR